MLWQLCVFSYTRNAKALSVPSDYQQVTNIVYGTLVALGKGSQEYRGLLIFELRIFESCLWQVSTGHPAQQ
jgi:hypothetical protein